ncbi:MAG TPA: CYTH domain-containing protein [Flavobacteriaceae bacterium]|nr:CYTH domain-containing protein [Flavobacteriaceae bacterium]MCB9212022.1 CYTH domain-containing protein [Alteromonas sp.]HPF09884.1 CYTH domain-containing protein [Flavobacteriaceae bacterium]HQU19981.1 CYTH domain-containing protein [Flavobacteriaceae bacterium]HQU64033.1 CYTH domain-containing protein [Flavobacteriaceae bacterium]
MIEIERKFLVLSEAYKNDATSKGYIVQGFLNLDPERTVRVRIKDNQGMLTVKGKSSEDGTTRFEWETAISMDEAKQLLQLCEEGIIEKQRYEIPFGNHIFEVDEFLGANEGLVLAEVELKDVTQKFDTPDWLGEEVTGQNKYYNSQLSKNPFNIW